jgi:hypothetical protein
MDYSDIIKLVLKGIMIVGSFASLIALCVYMFRVSAIWYKNTLHLSEMLDNSSMTSKEAIFPCLAFSGLLVCLFTGLKAMLFWIPDSWGLSDALGAMFAFMGCLWINSFIQRVIKEKIVLSILKVTIAGEREIYAVTSLAQLKKLEADYDKRSKELEESCWEQIKAYRDLLELIELRKVTIAGEREICRATSLTRLEALKFNYNKKIDDLEDEKERPGYIDESYQKRVNAYHALINLIEARLVTFDGRAIPLVKSLIRLEVFESSYLDKIDDLEEERENPRYVRCEEEKNAFREQINAYRDLIHLIEIQKVTINGEKEIYESTTLAQLETLESNYSKKTDDLDVSCHEQRNVYRDLIHLIEFQKIILNGKKEIDEAKSMGQMEILESNYNKKIDDLEDEKERPCDISLQKQIKAYLLLRHVIEEKINIRIDAE